MARRERRINLAKEARWRGIVEGQRRSGLSIRAFCRREGLGEPRFHWWRRELKRRDRERGGSDGHGKRMERGPRQPAFAAVRLLAAGRGRGAPRGWVAQTGAETAIEVELVRGQYVRLRRGFDGETLKRVLLILAEPGC